MIYKNQSLKQLKDTIRMYHNQYTNNIKTIHSSNEARLYYNYYKKRGGKLSYRDIVLFNK